MPGACLARLEVWIPGVQAVRRVQNAGTPERQAVARGEVIFNTVSSSSTTYPV